MKPQAKLHVRRPIARRQSPSDLSEHAAAIAVGVVGFICIAIVSVWWPA